MSENEVNMDVITSIRARTGGLIPAAGRGRRMGGRKLLLAWPGPTGDDVSTIIESTFDGLLPYCDRGISVVTGEDEDAIAEALFPRSFRCIAGDSTASMFDSVVRGMKGTLADDGAGYLLVQPGDHPVVEPVVVHRLMLEMAAADAVRGIVIIPTFAGQGGHPILLNRAAVRAVIKFAEIKPDPPGGLGIVWEPAGCRVLRVACDKNPWIRLSLNTPDQYRAAATEWKKALKRQSAE